MNKKQKLNSLTWSYFWKQKIVEILKFIFIVGLIFIIPYSTGYLVSYNGQYGELDLISIWIWGLVVIFFIIFILLILGLAIWAIYDSFRDWIKSNWQKATKRANKDLRENCK